jgi:hypothetical protein
VSVERHHAEWLSLVEVSGPFLSVRVLSKTFPNEMEAHEPEARARLKGAFEEWEAEHDDRAVHQAFVRFVLEETLEHEGLLLEGQGLPTGCEAPMPIHGETLRPDMVVARSGAAPLLMISVVSPDQKLESPLKGKRWSASPATRMMELLHRQEGATGKTPPLGLVTNGAEWMLVWAKPGQTTGFATFRSDVLIDEVVLLRAFRTLLGRNRFFGVPDEEMLAALFEESAQDQKEVTDQLGRQVRTAVSTLISSFDLCDRDQDRKLLSGVDEKEIYQASLTVMMRLVFLLCAEERGLLLLGKNELYDQYYALSPLRAQLQEAADLHGDEALYYRRDAWSRLLSLFRAVHAGLAHEDLRLPAYGGSLFDPDRFPFLEGRQPGTLWKDEPAAPLPVDNLTVLGMLKALQILEVRGKSKSGESGSQRLSYRALDIEQIGHVYEGLLDHTAARAKEPIVGLVGRDGSGPDLPLYQLESWAQEGPDRLLESLKAETKRTAKAVEKGLYEEVDYERILRACDGDDQLAGRVRPFAGLVRETPGGRPAVLTERGIYVTHGSDRRSTGTHYTPRGLTEEIVQHALDPLVYAGMADGVEPTPDTLRTPEEILDLKVCDMAMGSGAFLVQACRYLSDKLAEAWKRREAASREPLCLPYALPAGESTDLLPPEGEERMAVARRLVAERCLYGVDKNPLAVEMAKLSLWLITLDAQKPFSFLDHALRCGDSLLGITHRDQLRYFNLDPNLQAPPVFGDQFLEALERAEELRRKLESFSVREPRDGERKAALLKEAEEATAALTAAADMLIAVYLNGHGKPKEADLNAAAAVVADGLSKDWKALATLAQQRLDREKPAEASSRRPFHWALEFPEVMVAGGFNAIVGNPPFQGGKKITGASGTDYREFLIAIVACGQSGGADLCAYFLLRAAMQLQPGADMAFLTTNTIREGDTREVGLDRLTELGFSIPRAVPSRKWPGEAVLEVTHLWLRKGPWSAECLLDGLPVRQITPFLTAAGNVEGKPFRLHANIGRSFIGSVLQGVGFAIDPAEAEQLVAKNPNNREVLSLYLNGKDLNSSPEQSPSRWVINFQEWPLEKAQLYPDCLSIVEQRVRPERANKSMAVANWPWWKFWRTRAALYTAIACQARVLVTAEVSKFISFAFRPVGEVFSHMLVVFAYEDSSALALLQSSLCECWNRDKGSSMRTDFRFTPSDCFDTFPFPANLDPLEAIGACYETHRREVMLSRQEGLTATYNRFHDPSETSTDIAQLRALHQEMDQQVAAAYGWTDLDLGHGFHQTKQGLRYTISDPARLEVLDRLLALNHERYAEEVAQGLHDKGKKAKKPAKAKKQAAPEEAQGLLF